MKTRGRQSVAIAIINALQDIKSNCELNNVAPTFNWYGFTVRLRAYIGSDYSPSDEMIKVRMRKIQRNGFLDRDNNLRTFISYNMGNNGVYKFDVKIK